MNRLNDETGEGGPIPVIFVGAVVALAIATFAWRYWYITVPIIVLIAAALILSVRRRQAKARTREAELKRVAETLVADLTAAGTPAADLQNLGRAAQLLAEGQAPSIAMLERRLRLTRSAAGAVMTTLEELGLVEMTDGGRSRRTAAERDVLEAVAGAARIDV